MNCYGPEWSCAIDEAGDHVDVKVRSNEAGIAVCGARPEGSDMICLIMSYDHRRHDSPHIFWPAHAHVENPVMIISLRRICRPTSEQDLWDETDSG